MKWIEVDQRELNEPRRETLRNGAEVQVFVSPNDIPTFARAEFSKAEKRFVMEFRYLSGEEETVERPVDTNLKVFVGKHSNRLYRIEINVNNFTAEQLELYIPKWIDELEQVPQRPQRHGNYETVRKLLNSRRELFSDLVGTGHPH